MKEQEKRLHEQSVPAAAADEYVYIPTPEIKDHQAENDLTVLMSPCVRYDLGIVFH